MIEFRPAGMMREVAFELRKASAERAFRQGKMSAAEYRAGLARLEARQAAPELQETSIGSVSDYERHFELLKLAMEDE